MCFQVIHTRIEQSLDQFGDASNHFEFEWEVTNIHFGHKLKSACGKVRYLLFVVVIIHLSLDCDEFLLPTPTSLYQFLLFSAAMVIVFGTWC
jgi:hypothetical protein